MLERTSSAAIAAVIAAACALSAGAGGAEQQPRPAPKAAYWRAPERTPGPLQCPMPAATGVTVVCNRWPDGSDVRRFGLDAIRLCGAKTDHEKCLAVYRWVRRWLIFPDKRVGPPTEKIAARHHKRGFVDQALKQLNVYGCHWCDGQVRAMEAIWRALGYRAEKIVRGGHTIIACHYRDDDGVARWHALDVSHSGLLFDRTGRRLLSLDELTTRYYNFYYQYIVCPHNAWDDHRMELSLRIGERLDRAWGNWQKPYQDNIARGDRKVPAGERGPYKLDYGNGRWTYRPDLAGPDWHRGLARPPRGAAAGKLQPAAPGTPAAAVWDFRTPYIISDAAIGLRVFRKGPRDRIRLHLSVDDGKTWKPLWTCPDDVVGRKELSVPICETFRVTGKAEPPEGLHSPFGRYAYRLKLELLAADRPDDCRVEDVRFETVVQQNLFSLPQLQPGCNRITVRGRLAGGAALKVTYVWKDPLGAARKNVTVVERTPHTYEIVAAGRKWEDCICESIAVEAVAATGEGSRTIVKEAPAEIYSLPPMRPVAETATAWYQPRGKDLPPIEQVIESLRAGRDLRKAVSQAAMLADARAFEAVRKVAFEAADERTKHQAMVALFVMDRRRARPVLFGLIEKKQHATWDTRKDKTGQAPWIAAHAVVGYLAAEAGWTEFLPVMLRALKDPTAWPGWGPRYGLIRVIGRLGRGDRAAARAIDDVLTSRLIREHGDARATAALAAGLIGLPAPVAALRKCLTSSYEPTKHHAALSLGRLGDTASAGKLRAWLAARGDENTRAAAAEALGLLKDRPSLPALREALRVEPFGWVREKIAEAIRRIEAP